MTAYAPKPEAEGVADAPGSPHFQDSSSEAFKQTWGTRCVACGFRFRLEGHRPFW